MNEKSLSQYFSLLYERKWIILVLMLSALLGSVGLSLLFPKIYEAHVALYIPATPDVVSLVSSESAGTLLGRPPLPTGSLEQARSFIGVLKGKDITRTIHARFPSKSVGALGRDVDYTAGREGLLHIYVRDRDPELAAAVANAYPEVLEEFMSKASLRRVTENRAILETQIKDVQDQLAAAQNERSQFQEKHHLSPLQGRLSELTNSRSEFQSELDAAEVKLKEIQESIRSTKEQMAGEAKIYSRTRDSLYESLRQSLVRLEVDKETQQTRIRALTSTMAEIDRRALSMPKIMEEGDRLSQNVQRLQAMLGTMERNIEELKGQQLRNQQVVMIVETAEPPASPVFPVLWLNALVSLGLGLIAGVAYVFFLDYLEEESRHKRFQAVQLQGVLQAKPGQV